MKRLITLTVGVCLLIQARGQDYSRALTDELTEHYEAIKLPGFAVAIVNADGVLYTNGFGLADIEDRRDFSPSTIQNLGSVSKTVVGLALVKAIEEGALTMDTEVNEILPFQIINPYFKDSPITVRQLANHTSTIRDTKNYRKSYILDERFTPNENIHQDYLAFIKSHESMELREFIFHTTNKEGDWYKKNNFLKSQPGSTSGYANLNAALAAYIIELATETPFEVFTKEKIFEPLGMKNTSWEIDNLKIDQMSTLYFPNGKQVPRYRLITYPDGGLLSNVEDLSIFLREMIKAYAGKSEYLHPKYAQLLLPGDKDMDRAFWGMGVKSRNIGHGGSDPGVQTDLQFNADRKIGRIIMTNVNAEDNETLWRQYREIHNILAKYEAEIVDR